MAASGNISCFLRNVPLLLKDIKKKCAIASKYIFLRKNVQLPFLELYPLKKYFEVIKLNIMIETLPQKPITFMYFSLNYVDKGNVERIPIGVEI